MYGTASGSPRRSPPSTSCRALSKNAAVAFEGAVPSLHLNAISIGRAMMAAVRQRLVDASDKLKFSDLKAIDDEVSALTIGVGGLPLSEGAARVSQRG